MPDLGRFIEDVASDSPAPGGGSVSALASALACALAQMVSGISLKKDVDDDLAKGLQDVLERSRSLRATLISLVDEDSRAYGQVVDAYSLPKATPKEAKARKDAIQRALAGAAEVPLRTMKASLQALEIAELLAEKGLRTACSDVGVAALLAHAGLHGAHLNVMINLASIKDDQVKVRMENEASSALERGKELLGRTLAIVDSRLQ